VFAGCAALGSRFAALFALGVVHEVFKNFRAVQLYHPIHVFFCLFGIWTEEVFYLVLSNLVPVSTVYDFSSKLWQHLYNEGTRTTLEVTVTH